MTVKANTVWDWLKKWGLWILLALAFLLFILSKLLPSPKGKPEVLQKAKEQATDIKNAASQALEKHNLEMEMRKDELAKIQTIHDEKARLQALADFANRRK